MLENYRTVYFITISDVELSTQMKFYFMILLDLMRITKKLRRLRKLFMIFKVVFFSVILHPNFLLGF